MEYSETRAQKHKVQHRGMGAGWKLRSAVVGRVASRPRQLTTKTLGTAERH